MMMYLKRYAYDIIWGNPNSIAQLGTLLIRDYKLSMKMIFKTKKPVGGVIAYLINLQI